MKSRTNRRPSPFVRVALALSMVLMAACGGDGGDQTEAADTGASGSASSASASEPSGSAGASAPAATEATDDDSTDEPDAAPEFRTIEHLGGTTDVPVDPKNILALDEYSAFQLWDLGFEPTTVYASLLTLYTEPVANEMGVELTEHLLADPAIEAAAAIAPDLIVSFGHPVTLERYDLWSEAGPMFLYSDAAPWQEQLTRVGEALGAEDVAAQRIAGIDAEIARIAAEIDAAFETPPTVSIMGSGEGFGPFAAPAMLTTSGALLDQLGLDRPDAQRVEVNPALPLIFFSEETLLDHDADFVFVLADGGFYGDGMGDLPLFPSLTGTTANVSGEFWLGTFPFAVSWILADIEAVLLGDGVTRTGADVVDHWNAYRG